MATSNQEDQDQKVSDTGDLDDQENQKEDGDSKNTPDNLSDDSVETSEEDSQEESDDDSNEGSNSEDDSEDDESEEVEEVDLAVIKELQTKWKLKSTDEVLKKVKELESHVGKLQNENKEFRDAALKTEESYRNLEVSSDPDLQALKNKLDESGIFSSLLEKGKTLSNEEKDQKAFAYFLEKNPLAETFKDEIWEISRDVPLEFPAIWKLTEKLFLSGAEKGSAAEAAKSKAGVGSNNQSQPSIKEKDKLTKRQIYLAQKFGNDPKEVYSK